MALAATAAAAAVSRDVVQEQIYDLSSGRYEKLGREGPETDVRRWTMEWSHWVGSEKSRRHTGWRDVRMGRRGWGGIELRLKRRGRGTGRERERTVMKVHSVESAGLVGEEVMMMN